jgi:hypothetical protein
MRCPLCHRIFVIALLLSRLVLPDVMQLPAAQAATSAPAQPMTMAVQHCPGMDRMPMDNHGACCNTPQCACLHAPALMQALQMPVVFNVSHVNLPPDPVQRVSTLHAVFFRPPI